MSAIHDKDQVQAAVDKAVETLILEVSIFW